MNKNILAIAIAAAVAAPSAFAAATVYGNAHMSIDSLNNGDETVNAIASNSSYIGIKGDEDLGGGLKAVYQYEMQVGFDGDTNDGTNAGLQSQRNSYVGLGGGFGTVLMGIHDTPVKMVGRKYDLFGDRVGDMRNLTARGSWDLRPSNVLAYASPSFGGVTFLGAYVFQEANSKVNTVNGSFGNADNTDAYSMMVSYAAGKFGADLGYENHSKGFSGAADKALGAVRLGASYDFGMAKVHAFYANQDEVVGTGTKTRNIYGLGAGIKAGAAGTVKLQAAMADSINSGSNGASMYVVGYDHAMSKNTTVYAAYAMTNNDANGTYTVSGGGHGEAITPAISAAGKDPSALSVGVQHKF